MCPPPPAVQVLGDKGLAVSVAPPESTLEGWGRLVLQVRAGDVGDPQLSI